MLLLLMLMSGLAAALSVNGQTETLVSRNQRSVTQATAAAEAGLNHAVALAITYISEWNENGLADVDAAIAALLLGPDGASGTPATDWDNGSLGTRTGITFLEELPIGTRLTITGGINAEYEAFVMDDDDAPDEDGIALNDLNQTLLVRAIGYAEDDTRVVLEAVINNSDLPAVVVNGDLEISIKAAITGTVGGVHANGDLTIKGNDVSVTGPITASGAYTGLLPGSSGAAEYAVAAISASDYLAKADFILTSAGELTEPDGTVLCVAGKDPCDAWDFDSAKGIWEIKNNDNPQPGTYYVEGDVEIKGKLGGEGNPTPLSIIAEGSIDIKVNAHVMASDPEVLFVTDGDLQFGGVAVTDGFFVGQILVHEQMELKNKVTVAGQFIVEDAPSVDGLVKGNSISNDVVIQYSGELGGNGVFSVAGWRDVRDAN